MRWWAPDVGSIKWSNRLHKCNEEYRGRNRHNVECFLRRCTIFRLAKLAFFRYSVNFTSDVFWCSAWLFLVGNSLCKNFFNIKLNQNNGWRRFPLHDFSCSGCAEMFLGNCPTPLPSKIYCSIPIKSLPHFPLSHPEVNGLSWKAQWTQTVCPLSS